MKAQPRNRIASSAKKVWRINASLYMLLVVIAAGVVTYFQDAWSIPDLVLYIGWGVIIAALFFLSGCFRQFGGRDGVMRCLSRKYTYKAVFSLSRRQLYR